MLISSLVIFKFKGTRNLLRVKYVYFTLCCDIKISFWDIDYHKCIQSPYKVCCSFQLVLFSNQNYKTKKQHFLELLFTAFELTKSYGPISVSSKDIKTCIYLLFFLCNYFYLIFNITRAKCSSNQLVTFWTQVHNY